MFGFAWHQRMYQQHNNISKHKLWKRQVYLHFDQWSFSVVCGIKEEENKKIFVSCFCFIISRARILYAPIFTHKVKLMAFCFCILQKKNFIRFWFFSECWVQLAVLHSSHIHMYINMQCKRRDENKKKSKKKKKKTKNFCRRRRRSFFCKHTKTSEKFCPWEKSMVWYFGAQWYICGDDSLSKNGQCYFVTRNENYTQWWGIIRKVNDRFLGKKSKKNTPEEWYTLENKKLCSKMYIYSP